MPVDAVPGFDLQPSSEQVLLQTNYITNFDFLNQYLPDTYEKEFERYGNRTVASFLRMVIKLECLLTLTLLSFGRARKITHKIYRRSSKEQQHNFIAQQPL